MLTYLIGELGNVAEPKDFRCVWKIKWSRCIEWNSQKIKPMISIFEKNQLLYVNLI